MFKKYLLTVICLFPFVLQAQVAPMAPWPVLPPGGNTDVAPLPPLMPGQPLPPDSMPGAIPPLQMPPPQWAPMPPPGPVSAPLPGAPDERRQPFPGLTGPDGQQQERASEGKMNEIINFWFGYLPGPDYFPEDKMQIWFANTPEIDRQVRMKFAQDLINAEKGDYNSWRDTPRGRLALILLLDQVPRYLFRNQPQSFMMDRMARAIVLEGIQKGDDKDLYPIERAFFYLPLKHAEDLDMQNLSVNLYRQLAMQSPEGVRLQLNDVLQSAIMHRQQIVQFGRFPNRNAILNRESTPEETVFLMQWIR